MWPDSRLGSMIQVQCPLVSVLQGRPHCYISETVMVQIRKSSHGKAKPGILGERWLKGSMKHQQILLVMEKR